MVGAGAVGQVFGRHLQSGGAEVTFFVKETHRHEAERGFDLYPLNRRARTPERFAGFSVVTAAAEVAARRFDHVFLTVSSPALRGEWLGELLRAAGDATVVLLQPGFEDRALVAAAGVTPDRLVSGLIAFVSYAAPLPGETFPSPGMAYWFPPGAPSRFSGPTDRTSAVVQLLRRGGLPAKRHPDVPRVAAFPTAILTAYVAALERAGWSMSALVRGPELALAARGAREALSVLASSGARAPLLPRLLTSTFVLRLATWLLKRLAPFPLEAYLARHFTKVREQTRLLLSALVARGRAAGLDVAVLERLASSAATP